MLKFIALIVPFGLVALLLYAALRSGRFRVQRSIRVQAPAARIFPLVDNLRRWQAWSPFENIDPSLERDYSGPHSGHGAYYAWEGKRLGHGSLFIRESVPAERVTFDLDRYGRCAGQNHLEFTFEQHGEVTEVTWSMSGENRYFARLVSLFLNIDKLIGRQFETGLAKLKDVVEGNTRGDGVDGIKLLRSSGVL